MKKNMMIGFFVALILLSSSPVFALNCKTGNYGSDECWTTGQLRATGENIANLVAGTVMVYDFVTPTQHGLEPNSDSQLAFFVRAAGTTLDNHVVAGVYQGTQTGISSGDRIELLVRGQGKLRSSTTTVSTGDLFYVATQSGTGNFGEARSLGKGNIGIVPTQTADKSIAWALENATAATTNDAYITVV